MITYLVIVATIIFSSINGSESRTARIRGGEVDTIRRHPYVVRIDLGYNEPCTGTIIAEDIILTTAHCLPSIPRNWEVRAGSPYDSRIKGTIHDVVGYKIHPRFQRKITPRGLVYVNDVAILKIQPPFVFSKEIAPIPMLEADEKLNSGTIGAIVGWGMVPMGEYLQGSPEAQSYNQFRSVEVPIIRYKTCARHYRRVLQYDLEPGQLCAGVKNNKRRYKPKKGACSGDDGGPLIVDGRLAGMVSWGNDCTRDDHPGVFTDIAYFRNWIDELVNKMSEFKNSSETENSTEEENSTTTEESTNTENYTEELVETGNSTEQENTSESENSTESEYLSETENSTNQPNCRT